MNKRWIVLLVSALLAVVALHGLSPSWAQPGGYPTIQPVIRARYETTTYDVLPGTACWPKSDGSNQCVFLEVDPTAPITVMTGTIMTFIVDPLTPAPKTFQATLLDETGSAPRDLAANAGQLAIDTLKLGKQRVEVVASYPGDAANSEYFVTFYFLLEVVAPVDLPTPTAEATQPATAEPTAEPTAEVTPTPTPEPTEAPTAEPTQTPTAEPTEPVAATAAVVPTATPEPTVESTPEKTPEPTEVTTQAPVQATPEPTQEVTVVATPEPTAEVTPEPATATPAPTIPPTVAPTATVESTVAPASAAPTATESIQIVTLEPTQVAVVPTATAIPPTQFPTATPTLVPPTLEVIPPTPTLTIPSPVPSEVAPTVIAVQPTALPTLIASAPRLSLLVGGTEYDPIAVRICPVAPTAETRCSETPLEARSPVAISPVNAASQIAFLGNRPTSVIVTLLSADAVTVQSITRLSGNNVNLYTMPNLPGSYILAIEVVYPEGNATFFFRVTVGS